MLAAISACGFRYRAGIRYTCRDAYEHLHLTRVPPLPLTRALRAARYTLPDMTTVTAGIHYRCAATPAAGEIPGCAIHRVAPHLWTPPSYRDRARRLFRARRMLRRHAALRRRTTTTFIPSTYAFHLQPFSPMVSYRSSATDCPGDTHRIPPDRFGQGALTMQGVRRTPLPAMTRASLRISAVAPSVDFP